MSNLLIENWLGSIEDGKAGILMFVGTVMFENL